MISELIDDTLLRSVRQEILAHLHFTPKETDIYKIHQSGDLANLDGLDDASLRKLPSLLRLRDAMYSPAFRSYISTVANSGPLSGRKTDMAINVYTPGCHLLCHDDVIGSRRLSYILYLTDPEFPWQAEWGGALRLYPTRTEKASDGSEAVIPSPEFTVVIPPAFNQLSFFTIQPGKSFHDVEEVYRRKEGEIKNDGGRMRMAISGWFHIPQEGEDGYEPGLEERLTEKSSLNQLQSKADEFDAPQPKWRQVAEGPASTVEEPNMSEADLEWLLKYINPSYLTPDTVEQLAEDFEENSAITLTDFLHPKFVEKLKDQIEQIEKRKKEDGIPPLAGRKKSLSTGTACPPHKHRYQYRATAEPPASEAECKTPLDLLLEQFFPSELFARYLSMITGLEFTQSQALARRFRKGLDYTLAQAYEDSEPQLELCLGLTPTPGWGADDEDEEEDEDENEIPAQSNLKAKVNGKANGKANGTANKPNANEPPSASRPKLEPEEEVVIGGYEMYMAGDDEDDSDNDSIDLPANAGQASSMTGAGQRRKTKADPAIYKSSADDEDDGVLFTNPASWNCLSLVLRDRGVLKFVKYVSESAKGDRWDVVGAFKVKNDGDDDEEEGGDDDDEEEFQGFDD